MGAEHIWIIVECNGSRPGRDGAPSTANKLIAINCHGHARPAGFAGNADYAAQAAHLNQASLGEIVWQKHGELQPHSRFDDMRK